MSRCPIAVVVALAVVAVGPVQAAARKATPSKVADAARGLIAQLKNPSAAVRAAAARQLGTIIAMDGAKNRGGQADKKYAGAVPALIRCLDDDGDNVPPLRNAVRLSAAQALANIGPAASRAVPALMQAVEDGNPYAVLALGFVGTAQHPRANAIIDLLVDALQNQAETYNGTKTLVSRIGYDEQPILGVPVNVRSCAAHSLSRIGKPAEAALPALVKMLKTDRCADARAGAAAALGTVGLEDDAHIPLLIAALRDPSEWVNYCAVKSLKRFGPRGVPLLSRALAKSDVRLCRGAASALAQLGQDAAPALPGLTRLLKHRSKPVRLAALKAIGSIGLAATEAVAAVAACLDNLGDGGKTACETLAKLGPDAVPALAKVLKHRETVTRRHAAEALGEIGIAAAPAVPQLIELLGERNRLTRMATLEALGKIGPAAAAAVPAVKKMQQDGDRALREQAEFVLGKIEN